VRFNLLDRILFAPTGKLVLGNTVPFKAGAWTLYAQLVVVELRCFLWIETTARSAVREAYFYIRTCYHNEAQKAVWGTISWYCSALGHVAILVNSRLWNHFSRTASRHKRIGAKERFHFLYFEQHPKTYGKKEQSQLSEDISRLSALYMSAKTLSVDEKRKKQIPKGTLVFEPFDVQNCMPDIRKLAVSPNWYQRSSIQIYKSNRCRSIMAKDRANLRYFSREFTNASKQDAQPWMQLRLTLVSKPAGRKTKFSMWVWTTRRPVSFKQCG